MNKKKDKPNKVESLTTRILDRVCNIIILAVVIYVLYWVVQVTTACSFHTPSGSMTPTLQPDESGLVNKWKMGARIFNIIDAAEGKPYEIRRLPGYGHLERGDVIVFNYPYQDRKDSIAMNLGLYYCKRAVGIPGDTLEIIDCFYHVRGCPDTLGVASEQRTLQAFMAHVAEEEPNTRKWNGWQRIQPKDSILNWTVKDMGPLIIPGEGTEIELDRKNWLLYRRYIEWETGRKLQWRDSVAVMDGKPLKTYRFKENYCFAAGDHAIDSRDSRYFGLVPEKFIVGVAGILWKTKDGKRRFRAIK